LGIFVVVFGPLFAFFEDGLELFEAADEEGNGYIVECERRGRHLALLWSLIMIWRGVEGKVLARESGRDAMACSSEWLPG
jgi:hypothetical protein